MDINETEIETKSQTWASVLEAEKKQPYFQQALNFVKEQRTLGKKIYPPEAEVFNAFRFTPYDELKVVIIGQDPYHGPNQAHGLAFSVKPGVVIPPSLRNILKELHTDLNIPIPKEGCLIKWAQQGVLLLNTTLTVEASKPLSHAKIGWEHFTDRVIEILNAEKEELIFLLWGAHAQRKGEILDPQRHHIYKAAHPSPFSADRGFFGCQHFSKTNSLLRKMGKTEIDWRL